MSPLDLRLPDPTYTGRNGFRESSVSVDRDHPDHVTLRNHRLSQYILANMGSYVPSPETLRELGGTASQPVETVESIEKKIKELKKQHAKDLENLFAFQVAEYYQELIDHRSCYDDSAYMDIDSAYPDQVNFNKALQDLDKDMCQRERFKRDMDDGLDTIRYTYLKTLLYLSQKRNVLRAREKDTRKKRDAWFPQTIQQYRQITDRDGQLRVARFLSSSTTEQEKMRDEFGWPYRTVQPLYSIYKSDTTFQDEINDTMKDIQVLDPRRRAIQTIKASAEPIIGYTRFSPIS
ncbi:hypothetical protein PAXINDRAFT_83534 [Paxillus involutus ATCC 200175]|uniref:Uncharacterized protein n=1 Tax=Paxillus involutus ATCC 200175 TaxID=664439 RepID=A0A0C9STE3_PAXIN|nr:hypothetical protein PAXINDRAFT_83534 [Paxillus involutus ATCC 200175]